MKSKYKQSRLSDLSPAQDFERETKASQIYSKVLREKGVKVVSLDELTAWKEYVGGQISDPELNDKARMEIDNLELTFGKYLITENKSSSSILSDPVKRARARLANKIYKSVCKEKKIDVCFFNNFQSWSDYVRGAISESEFHERAEAEVEQMLAY